MTSAERRAVLSLSLLYAFRMLGLFMVLPVLAVYAGDFKGATPALIGLALGIYGLTQATLQIPAGLLSDRWGRKPVILLGLAIFGLGSVIAASADTIGMVIFGRALQGCGAIASALMALLADVTREDQRSKAMAGLGASIGLSFAAAVVLGPLLSSRFGVSAVFAVTAALAVIGVLVVIWLVPTPQRLGQRSEAIAVPALLGRCLRDSELWRLNSGVFVLHFSMTAAFTVVPLWLEQAGIDRAVHWHVYLPVLLLSFLLMLPVMVAAERAGWLRQALRGMALVLILALGMAAAAGASVWLLLAALLAFFFAFNWLEATLPALLSRLVHPGAKGTAMGIYSCCQFLGAFAGGAGAGLASQWLGSGAGLWLGVAVAVIWLPLAWSFRPPARAHSLVVECPADAAARRDFADRVSRLPGVEEVTLLAQSGQAFLRVNDEFDPARLAGLNGG